MSDEIVVEARRDRQDMHSAAWLVFWRSRAWAWPLIAAAAFGVLAWPGNGTTGAIAGGVAMFVALMVVASGFVVDRAERGAKALATLGPAIHRFSPNGLEIEVAGAGAAKWPWDAFVGAIDNDRVLLLRRRDNYPIVIPKRQIGENWSRLQSMLSAALNGRAAFKREQRA